MEDEPKAESTHSNEKLMNWLNLRASLNLKSGERLN